MNDKKIPVLYVPHGGGPWPYLEDGFGDKPGMEKLRKHLEELGARLRPHITSILVISAHWESEQPTLLRADNPSLYYDYFGFPPHTYTLSWPNPGNPALADRSVALLSKAGFTPRVESARGWDHGVFIPLGLMFPKADVPMAQLSLLRNLDPSDHFALGAALEPLRSEGVLIIGSGMSYHNMRGFGSGKQALVDSKTFDAWLKMAAENGDAVERKRLFVDWEDAPSARQVHPREEHLATVFVAAGAAGADRGKQLWADLHMGVMISSYAFGEFP